MGASWVTDEMKDQARQYLINSGNADVLQVLGLQPLELDEPGDGCCARCGHVIAPNHYGRCRRLTCQK